MFFNVLRIIFIIVIKSSDHNTNLLKKSWLSEEMFEFEAEKEYDISIES